MKYNVAKQRIVTVYQAYRKDNDLICKKKYFILKHLLPY